MLHAGYCWMFAAFIAVMDVGVPATAVHCCVAMMDVSPLRDEWLDWSPIWTGDEWTNTFELVSRCVLSSTYEYIPSLAVVYCCGWNELSLSLIDWATGDPHRGDGQQAHPQRNAREAEEDLPAPRPAPDPSPGDLWNQNCAQTATWNQKIVLKLLCKPKRTQPKPRKLFKTDLSWAGNWDRNVNWTGIEHLFEKWNRKRSWNCNRNRSRNRSRNPDPYRYPPFLAPT